jgi:rod shape determining protein RodA
LEEDLPRTILLDWPLLFLGLLLSACGLVLVYSATWEARDPPGFYASSIFVRQCLAFVIALLCFYFVRRIKWGLKPASWVWFYVPVMLLLIAVLLIGHESGTDARRWIDLGFFKLQPSEPAKVAWLLMLAWLFSAPPLQLKRSYFIALTLMLSMVALMMEQPDLGTSMVFVFTFFVLAWLAPIPRNVVRNTMIVFGILVLTAWPFLRMYQQNRVLAMVGWQRVRVVEQVRDERVEISLPGAQELYEERIEAAAEQGKTYRGDPPELGDILLKRASIRGTIYQAYQGTIALGSGGLTGKGFLRGTQNKKDFVPEAESDFVFAVAGEEFGFVGSVFIIGLFLALIVRILGLAARAHTPYERYICYGASAVLLFHVFINIGMTMKIVPVTGVPLPFLSQGGSSLISFWIMLAVLESIHEKSMGEYGRLRRRTA